MRVNSKKKTLDPTSTSKIARYGPKRLRNGLKKTKLKKYQNKKSDKMKDIHSIWVNAKKIFRPHPKPKDSPIGPKKAQSDQQNQK